MLETNSFIRGPCDTDRRSNVTKENEQRELDSCHKYRNSNFSCWTRDFPRILTIHVPNGYIRLIGETDPRNNPENERFSPWLSGGTISLTPFNLTAYTSFVDHPSDIRPFHLSSAIYARRLNGFPSAREDFRGFRCLKENFIKIAIAILPPLVVAAVIFTRSMYLIGAKKLVSAIRLSFLYFYFPFTYFFTLLSLRRYHCFVPRPRRLVFLKLVSTFGAIAIVADSFDTLNQTVVIVDFISFRFIQTLVVETMAARVFCY